MEIIINPPSSPVFFHIFDYPVRYYGFILSFAILAGIFISEYLVKIKHDNKTLAIFQNSIPLTVIWAIIGARLFYVIGSFDYYKNNLKEIIMINHGGISILGAIIFAMFTIYIYTTKKRVSFLKYVDFYALIMPLCQAIGRFGNYFNQEAYGAPCDGIIKLYVDRMYRNIEFIDISYFHPTFLYESILDLSAFILLLFIYLKKKNLKSGIIFSLYLILYGFIRIFVESFRIDSVLNIYDIHIATIISFGLIIFGTILILLIKRNSAQK